MKYKEYLLFNKNILIGFVCAFIAGATVSQLILAKFSYVLNSLITLITEDVVFYTIFGILFYIDYKRSYFKQEQQSARHARFGDIKLVIVKLISTMSIAEIEYNIVKPYIQYWFLTQLFEPFVASVIGSLVGIAGFIAVADFMAYYTRLFKKKT
ncbi:MAG: hypothetical protein WAM14_21155 [Candidatus Nitrosopolaris sp.]